VELTPPEIRVLGCLIEKERTVPDAYPLSVNALVSACNQSTNRAPVVQYDERTVETALTSLKEHGFVRFVHAAHGSRVTRYRHVVDEAMGLESDAVAVLAVLWLRGPQTKGELRSRCERLHPFESIEEVDSTLRLLAARDPALAASIGRRPGEKEERWTHLQEGPVHAVGPVGDLEVDVAPAGRASSALADRLAALEARVARLESELGLGNSPGEEVAPTV
jgi:uncharacterized protein